MDKFETLKDETSILMINQDTFTVARLTDLVSKKLQHQLAKKHGNVQNSIAILLFQDFYIIEGEVSFDLKDIQLRFPAEGKECKLLNFETKEWEIGKLRIFADVKITGYPNFGVKINQVTVEFAPEKPTFEYESPLDEIRNSNL